MAVIEKTRKTKTKRYEIRLASETKQALFEMAKQEGKTAADVMRELIRQQAERMQMTNEK